MLAGTHFEGAFTVAQSTVNELLRMNPAPVSDCTVEVEAGNRLVVRYGVLHATATVDAFEAGPRPQLRLSLASFVVAMALRAALRQPYVRVSGRHVFVDLGRVPALQPYAAFWPHVRRVDIATAPGRLHVDVEVLVTE